MTTAEPAFFRGAWLEPGHLEYEQACPAFNLRIVIRPRVIARCAGVADVMAALAYAREHGLAVDVRSTGYSFGPPPTGDGVVIDLSLMRGIQILPEQRIARIQGGMRGGDLQVEAALHGLGAVTGVLSGSGVGLMLGGGIGYLGPRAGYASDNVLSVELVTAAGDVVTASAQVNPDLFWAVRGSTGNFGVVTALEVRLHDVPPLVHAGTMSWSLDRLGSGIEALRTSTDWASDNLSLIGLLSSDALAGGVGLDLIVCHSGPEDQARAELERLRSFGAPDADDVSALPFRDVHFRNDEAFPPMRGTLDDQAVGALTDQLVEALVHHIRQPAAGGAHVVEIVPHGGALGRAPEFPSALHEGADGPIWNISPGGYWEDGSEDDSHDRWVQDAMAVVRSTGPADDRCHPNAVGVARDPEAVARLYGDRFERLRRLKRQWDPDNVFRGSHNIPPTEI
jgi:FAD/FMN-containing dehydrogenase